MCKVFIYAIYKNKDTRFLNLYADIWLFTAIAGIRTHKLLQPSIFIIAYASISGVACAVDLLYIYMFIQV